MVSNRIVNKCLQKSPKQNKKVIIKVLLGIKTYGHVKLHEERRTLEAQHKLVFKFIENVTNCMLLLHMHFLW